MNYPEFPYSQVDDDNREHLKTLIRWLWNESISAGGDGDAFWYSRFFRVQDLFPLVKEVNESGLCPWEIKLDGETILWWHSQESVVITNDEERFKQSPDWIQAKIRY